MRKIIQTIKRARYVAAAAVFMAPALAVLPAQTAQAQDAAFSGGGGNGAVLFAQPLALPAELSSVATAKKVYYLSTDVNEDRVIVSAAILTPKQQYRPSVGQRHVVAWAHGTEGIANKCAPSNNPQTFDASSDYIQYRTAIHSYLVKGWTVAATDFQGLGTPGVHQYLVGDTEARGIVDSVRAARHLDSTLSNKWAVSGHSQGGQAALFANEIADTYGQGLQLKGAVAIAPASSLEILAAAVPGTPGNGYVVLALVGLEAADPSVDVEALLAQPAKDLLPVVKNDCWVEILTAYAGLTAEELLVGGALPQAVVDKLAHYGNPAQQAPTKPTLLVQGEADPVVPLELTQLLQSQMCPYDKPVSLKTYAGQDHDTVIDASLNDVTDYIRDRFNGLPAPSDC
jgi:pimeloyl-ACP methyl ester carboxylesterase